uniref:TTF-type domain-containing protein n=1 Tax=Amphimedon queenslandica TaxID=400682 RepID=A0A1X7VGB9_AMPQE
MQQEVVHHQVMNPLSRQAVQTLLETNNDHEACPTPSTQIDNIAHCVGSHLSDSDKYQIFKKHSNLEISNTFPKGKDSRSFHHQWLCQFPWLVYSSQENGPYCLPCVLFATRGYHNSDPGVLVSKPLTNVKKVLDILRNHVRKNIIYIQLLVKMIS